jgi:hypothetical protein
VLGFGRFFQRRRSAHELNAVTVTDTRRTQSASGIPAAELARGGTPDGDAAARALAADDLARRTEHYDARLPRVPSYVDPPPIDASNDIVAATAASLAEPVSPRYLQPDPDDLIYQRAAWRTPETLLKSVRVHRQDPVRLWLYSSELGGRRGAQSYVQLHREHLARAYLSRRRQTAEGVPSTDTPPLQLATLTAHEFQALLRSGVLLESRSKPPPKRAYAAFIVVCHNSSGKVLVTPLARTTTGRLPNEAAWWCRAGAPDH